MQHIKIDKIILLNKIKNLVGYTNEFFKVYKVENNRK